MKTFSTLTLLLLVLICFATSCKKEKQPPLNQTPPTRTIRFILYTNKDLSTDNYNITFSARIYNEKRTISFDSVLYRMNMRDIPKKANQLVFEKKVPFDGTDLTAGFVWEIESIGVAGHLDTCAANEKLKVIEYPFI